MSDTVLMNARSLIIVALVASLTAVGVRRCGGSRLAWEDVDWATIESFALRVDLTRPGRFHAEGDLALTGVTAPRVSFLLNRELEVDTATIAGKAVAVRHGARLRSRYFREGRVVQIEIPAVPPDGRLSLHLAYGGEAARGREGPDWRGILFVDAGEARMCEQTLFFPAVPMSTRGPNLHEARYALEVEAPAAWEVFVPAPGGPSEPGNAVRRWRFASERPGIPSILGGLRERTDTEVGGLRFVTLLREEHAALAPEFVAQATRALEDFAERFGAIEAGVVGVIEITCRDSSYNWTAEGVIAFDRGALSGSVPAEKLAHEVAHLWWGQAVDAAGDGERFLTEGLAEYSAWSHLRRDGRGAELARSVRSARKEVAKLARQGDSLPMAEVAFGVEHYGTLAYDKGALVLWALGAQLAPGQLDAALKEYASRGAKRETSLDDLRASLRSATGRADLRVPWLDGSGDLELALADVRADSGAGRVALEVRARKVPADAAIDPRGAPVAVALGGRGWSERHVVWLEGESTRVVLDTRGRPLAYVQLDPDAGWTLPVVDGVVVLDGASLVASTPSAERAAEFGGTRVVLQFDRALSPISADELQASWSGFLEEGAHLLSVARAVLSSDATELVLTTGPWYPDRRYRIPFGALRDADGLPVKTRSLEFAVAPSGDTQAPEIVATVPEVGAEVAAPSGRLAVSLTFDEPMRSGRAITNQGVRDIRARGFAYPKIDGFGSWDASGRILTYQFVELEAGVRYALPIRARGFHDLSGNPLPRLRPRLHGDRHAVRDALVRRRGRRTIPGMALTESRMLPLGSAAPEFSLPEPRTGEVRTLLELAADAPATLVMFMCNHCPYVQHVLDPLIALANEYAGKGVAVVAINSNDVETYPQDGPEAMASLAVEKAFEFPFLLDEDQSVARAYQAACTPDFFLFDGDRKLAYRGQLDASRPGNGVPVTGADLRAALDAVLAGGAPTSDQKPSVGCNIKWKPGNEPR